MQGPRDDLVEIESVAVDNESEGKASPDTDQNVARDEAPPSSQSANAEAGPAKRVDENAHMSSAAASTRIVLKERGPTRLVKPRKHPNLNTKRRMGYPARTL